MIMLLCEEWHRRTTQDTIGEGEEISKVSHSNHGAIRMFTHAIEMALFANITI